jgi:hypothetical protein
MEWHSGHEGRRGARGDSKHDQEYNRRTTA